jgi:phosphoglycolate phosphatase-like HAD superfamily hydrolase
MTAGRATVLLFDIDGTLLLSGGAGRRAFARAFAEVTGRKDACDGFSFGGMTDRAIARQGLSALSRPVDEATIEQLFEAYLHALADELSRTTGYTIMPGVHALLDRLAGIGELAIGLGTGNLRRGAEAKLRHGALWERFAFGGFGCDHEERSELLRRGAERGAALLGRPVGDCRVVVIGDTVRDVHAAHAIEATCIGVATGGVAPETLAQAGAAAVFRDLAQPGVLEQLLGAGHGGPTRAPAKT